MEFSLELRKALNIEIANSDYIN